MARKLHIYLIKQNQEAIIMTEIIYMFLIVLIFWFVIEIINERLNRSKKVTDVLNEFSDKHGDIHIK